MALGWYFMLPSKAVVIGLFINCGHLRSSKTGIYFVGALSWHCDIDLATRQNWLAEDIFACCIFTACAGILQASGFRVRLSLINCSMINVLTLVDWVNINSASKTFGVCIRRVKMFGNICCHAGKAILTFRCAMKQFRKKGNTFSAAAETSEIAFRSPCR